MRCQVGRIESCTSKWATNENKKFPPDISRTLEDYSIKHESLRWHHGGKGDWSGVSTSINKQRHSPSAHNNRGACASYQSTNARDPHRLAYEWSYSDTAHCCPNRIYHISVATAPAAENCWIEWADTRSSSLETAPAIRWLVITSLHHSATFSVRLMLSAALPTRVESAVYDETVFVAGFGRGVSGFLRLSHYKLINRNLFN